MKIKYDIVYSIGYDCACALYIKKAGLRLTAGPFDWLTEGTFEKRIECILNDFKDFLNPKDFELLAEQPCQTNLHYKNKRTGFYFYHDFPKNIPFKTVFPCVREKYQRRIERFYYNMKVKDRVLLIFFSQYTNTPNEKIKSLCHQVCQKLGKTIDFLIIEHKSGQEVPLRTVISRNILKYNLHITVLDHQNKPSLFGNEKLCRTIFENYTLPCRDVVKKKFLRLLSKLVVPLIPVKNIRKKLKHQLTA